MKITTALTLLALAAPAAAQVATTQSAGAQLFDADKDVVQLSSSLSKADQATIKTLIPLMEQQMQSPVKYYSSIAYVPALGLVSKALQGAFNYHSPAAADRAAMRACAAERPRRAGACRIAARVLPRGYTARPLTLSSDATRAFNSTYRRARGAKAFAISPGSGAWGMGASERSAVAACAKGGARDCRAVIRN